MSAGAPDAKALFLEALELRAELRPGFLAGACGSDAALRQRVEALLRAHGGAERWAAERAASAAPARVAPDLGPGARVGPYVLVSELGAGGFGRVFRARQDVPMRREVALKVLKLGMDTQRVIARFEVERQALALMDHPHIARALDAGATAEGRPYFAMELVEGEPLTDYCERRALSLERRLELLRDVCLALQHAHHKGVVHRDVKPSNVLVATVDGRALPKVIDFGIAKALAPAGEASLLTREGDVIGTPAYMSPEQVLGDPGVDTRSDVYSLGAVLYELLTGSAPFDAAELRAGGLGLIAHTIAEVDPVRPSRHPGGAGLSADLDWIAMRCLEKDPARRYPTAYALASDLERFLDGRPVEAAPPSTWYRVRKLAQRHRGLTAALVVVLGTLALGSVGTSLGLAAAVRANRDLDRALEDQSAQTRRALEAEEAARGQAALAGGVLEFLNEVVLGSVRPSAEAGRGRDARLVDVLDAAARRIELDAGPGGRFADQPLVEAGVREAVAGSYHSLGLYAAAEPHLRRVLELRGGGPGGLAERGARGPNGGDRAALRAAGWLGSTLRKLGRYGEALEVAEACHRAALEAFGPGDPDTLAAASQLGLVLWRLGHRSEAREVLEGALAEADRALGADGERALELAGNLAIVLAGEGRPEAARALFERVVEARLATLGDRHPDTVAALSNLAAHHQSEGRPGLAEPLHERTLEAQRQLLGPDHADTLVAAHNLGTSRRDLRRFDEAEALLADTRERFARTLGEDHPDTLRTAAALASTLGAAGRLTEADALLRRTLDQACARLGEDHPTVLSLHKDLAGSLHRLGRHGEAAERVEELLEREERVLGPADPATLRSLVNLALLRRALDDPAGAIELVERALARMAGERPATDHLVLDARGLLASLLCDLDRYPEAEPHAREVREHLLGRLSDGHPDLAQAAYRLGVALGGQGRFADAEPLLREAEERYARSHGRTHPSTLEAVHKLELVYRLWGRTEQAEHWGRELSERRGGPF